MNQLFVVRLCKCLPILISNDLTKYYEIMKKWEKKPTTVEEFSDALFHLSR